MRRADLAHGRAASTIGRTALHKRLGLGRRQPHNAPRGLEAVGAAPGHHDRQRLRRPALAGSQAGDGVLIGCVAQQVVAADAAHGDDAARRAAPPAAAASAGALPSILDAGRAPVKRGTAGGTRQGLGVKTPIERVGVFGGALRAQREAIERGIRPIVGHGADQRVARSALRAIDEWVAVAARRRVAEFRQALIAGEQIRRHMHVRLLA